MFHAGVEVEAGTKRAEAVWTGAGLAALEGNEAHAHVGS